MTQVTPPPNASLPPTPSPTPGRPGAAESWLPVVRALAVLVVVGVLLSGTLAVVSTLFTREHSESRSIGGTVSAVEITEDVGDIRVRTLPAGQAAQVTARITNSFQDPTWSAELRDGTLVVEGSCREDGFSLFQCSVDLSVQVPAGIPVSVTSDTGDISVIGRFSAVDGRTATGDVMVQDATGSVRLRTNTGDVRSLDTAAGDVSAETDTGDVRLSFEARPQNVSTRTNTGDITVLVPDDDAVYQVDADASVGDIRVDVADIPSAPNRILAETDTGDVRVAYR